MQKDTIFAEATAPGRAGVAVIRVSGPRAWDSVQKIAGSVPHPRTASLRILRDESGSILDEALVLVFEEGSSFTGEYSAEFQIHGSRAVVNALLGRLGRIEGFRMANAGEFTRRALENGTMDFTQVEALSDLLSAETEAQRRQAMRLLNGELSQKAATWRKTLVRALALLEAGLDFSDEEIPQNLTAEVASLASEAAEGMGFEIIGCDMAEAVRSGFEIAIVGKPNVGKSTLLNRIAQRDIALISDQEGTTRDVLEARLDLGGYVVSFLDTAGLRATSDDIEAAGVNKGRERARNADLRVFLLERDDEISDLGIERLSSDLVLGAKGIGVRGSDFSVSGLTGKGVEALLDRVRTMLEERAASVASATHLRHKVALESAVRSLEICISLLEEGESEDLAAEELRSAISRLDYLVGRVGVEDVLDVVFSSFCIGK